MVLGWGVKAVLVGMEELGSEYGVRSRHGELAGTDTDMACSRGAKQLLSESNRYIDGCANQPLLLSPPLQARLGDTFVECSQHHSRPRLPPPHMVVLDAARTFPVE